MRFRFRNFAAVLLFGLGCSQSPESMTASQRTLTPELRIGSETEGPVYQFSDITHVMAAGDDVYVVQRHVPEIRVFGRDGRHRQTIGREGQGPGEFETVWAAGLVGDSLWVIDINLRRLSVFTLGGALVSTVVFDPVPPTLGEGLLFLPYPESLMPDGNFLGFGRGSGRSVANGDITAQPLLRMTPEGRTADTLAWVSIRNDDLILQSDRSMAFMSQPFSDAPITVLAPLARRAYVIERWASTEPGDASIRVLGLNASGDTAWMRDVRYTPAALDVRLVDSVRGLVEKGYGARYPRDVIHRAFYAPSYRAPVSGAVAADDGSLWIQWGDETRPGSYTVIDPTGEVAGAVTVPSRARLLWVSDSVAWGAELDANDVPTLVRYRSGNRGSGIGSGNKR